MNKLNPKKLYNSKWTAFPAINKEKHFIIVEVEFDEDGNVVECIRSEERRVGKEC